MSSPRLAIPVELPAWREGLVAALLTPQGRGAVATIGLCGPKNDRQSAAATNIIAANFQPANGRSFEPSEPDRIHYGRWGNHVAAEDVIVTADPGGYEIHCHGGRAAARGILNDLTAAGARELDWRKWLWLTAANPLATLAAQALAQAATELAATALHNQLSGVLAAAFTALQNELNRALSEQKQYKHDLQESPALAAAVAGCDLLLATAPWGTHLTAPWRVALAGPPNAGKSSLLNALLGYERAIVFPQPGTTRDVVSGTTAWGGWLWEFRDTAGLRDAADELEAAGIALTAGELQTADAVVLVFDGAAPWRTEDAELLSRCPDALVVLNKVDLWGDAAMVSSENQADAESINIAFTARCLFDYSHVEIPLSAKTGAGVDSLFAALADTLLPPEDAPEFSGPILFCPELAGEVAAIRAYLSAGTAADISAAQALIARLLDF